MEQFGIIVNDRSNEPLLCEVYPENEIGDALDQTINFFKLMDMDVQIMVGPIDKILEILESNGIELTALQYSQAE